MSDSIYDDIPLSVCVLRKSRQRMDILFANELMAQMCGARTPAELAGKTLQEIWPQKDLSLFNRALMSVTPPKTYILPFEDPRDGERHWFHFDITEKQIEGQQVLILWGSDISADKRKEERLIADAQKADALAEMKGNFLATMSHEIRSPMQTIYGLLELISDEKVTPEVKTMAQTAQTAASGLLEILDDILDLAKMDANKMELDVFEVPLRTLVRGILEALTVKIQGNNIDLRDEIAPDVPFVVIGDPKRLRQIILNLAGNALKFTKQGHVTVRVSRDIQKITIPEKRIGLRFEIIDSGMGMSEETCNKLFQSFTQADNSTQREYGGTGLGLSICKKLVELMGGQIGVRSVEGSGSTFWFEIPTEEVSAETTTISLPNLEGISVISIEDHPQGAKEIVKSLRSMGATVESCPNGQEGLDLIRRRPFDVAITDQGLPDMLGLNLLKEITDIRPNTGLIMYTVRDDTGLAHSLQAMGVTYLTKPASRAGLGEAVRNAATKTSHFNMDGPRRLLIAEDTDSVRHVLGMQLQKLGVEADFAHNGTQALKALESGKYGILITDLHMPEMDGYGLVETIRSKEKGSDKHFPVIVMTADVQLAQRDAYLRYGFDECLLKPVSLGQFKRLMIRWGLLNEEIAANLKAEEKESPNQIGLRTAIDKEAMIEQMGGFGQNEIEMLGMFVDMTKPLILRLQIAHGQNDLRELVEIAHSLKGAARSACAIVLGDIAAQLQSNSEAGKESGDLLDKLYAEFDRVDQEIKLMQNN